jgi:hypothetical protein
MLTLPFPKNTLVVGALCAVVCVLVPAWAANAYNTTPYETMAKETLKLVAAGDLNGALKKARDLEAKWDSETADLRAAEPDLWGQIDTQMDAAIAALTADAKKATDEWNTYLKILARVPKPEKK